MTPAPPPEKPASARGPARRARHLLVGGSNCIVRGGFGEALQAGMAGRWRNQSLGSSSSLRGVDYLLGHPQLVERSDTIVFEYTLNDLIFEADHSLDPLTHRAWLRALAGRPDIARKLRFVMLRGTGIGGPQQRKRSFVADNYLRVAAEFGVPCVDLRPEIDAMEAAAGRDRTFVDGDHFTAEAVAMLARHAVERLEQPGGAGTLVGLIPPSAAPTPASALPVLAAVDPLASSDRKAAGRLTLRTSLLQSSLCRLGPSSRVTVRSPGGLLVGIYALCGRDAGWLRLTHRGHDILKAMRQRGSGGKSFMALRHLTNPLPTEEGEEIVLRHATDLDGFAHATIDATRAQLLGPGGREVAIGRLLFLRHPR